LARGCQASHAGRPRRFSRPRRFAPLHALQVCCTLLPAVGFATFPGLAADRPRCKHRLLPSTPPFPSGAVPFEVFPSTTAPVTSPRPASLSLFQLALFPFARRKRRTPVPSTGQPTSGLCSAAESVASPQTFPPACCPILPWASNHQGSARQRGHPRSGPTPTGVRRSQVSASGQPSVDLVRPSSARPRTLGLRVPSLRPLLWRETFALDFTEQCRSAASVAR